MHYTKLRKSHEVKTQITPVGDNLSFFTITPSAPKDGGGMS